MIDVSGEKLRCSIGSLTCAVSDTVHHRMILLYLYLYFIQAQSFVIKMMLNGVSRLSTNCCSHVHTAELTAF